MAKRISLLLLGIIVFGLWITGGWIATSQAQELPVRTPTPVPQIEIGIEVIVRVPSDPPGQTLRLREGPGLHYETVINLSDGRRATVIDGPEFSIEEDVDDGYAQFEWWKLQVGDYEGWAVARLDDFETLIPAARFATAVPCFNTLPPRLTIGETARSMPDRVSLMRAGPDPTYARIGDIPGRGEFTVLSGPRCYLNFYWWEVSYGDLQGWVAEGNDQRYWLEPLSLVEEDRGLCPGAPPQRLAVGRRAVQALRQTSLALRSSPAFDASTLSLLFPGDIVEVIGGPLCYPDGGEQTWWLVRTEEGLEGWAAEADDAQRFLSPYVPPRTAAPTRTPAPTATFTPTITPTGISADAVCVLTTLAGVNLRSGPGTSFDQIGSRLSGQLLEANGQATDAEGFTWWRLITDEFVREDFVSEEGDCDSLEFVTEFGTPFPGTPTSTPSPTIAPNAACVITTLNGVNLRSGPSVDSERSGSAATNTSFEADAQFTGSDGLTWWRLARAGQDTGSWVREDFVSEAGNCDTLPVVAS